MKLRCSATPAQAMALTRLSTKHSQIVVNCKYLSTLSNSRERKGQKLYRGRSKALIYAEEQKCKFKSIFFFVCFNKFYSGIFFINLKNYKLITY